MIKKTRLTVIVSILLVSVFGFICMASATDPPCRQKVLSICDEDAGALVCRLLAYNEPETVESISAFLSEISSVHQDIQQELICARLMGKKKIINLKTKLHMSPDASQCRFQSGVATFIFGINDPNYVELIKAHQKLKKFNLCPQGGIEFDISGMVMDVDTEYYNNNDSLKSFVFTLDEVRLSNIKTTYAKGGFDVQRKPLEKRIDTEYQKYFHVGTQKPTKKPKIEKKTSAPAINPDNLKTYRNSIGMEFILIPVNGEEDVEEDKFECRDAPVMKVSKPYYIGKYEVTQSQWESVMKNSPSQFKGPNLPVEMVSWNDVQEFIRKLNQQEGTDKYRLPSEAEWEFAARAGSTTAYCFGDDENRLAEYAWYNQNAGNQTHSVGELKPNAWGLHDMHGNVWEWCQDASGSYRVLRGGSWRNIAGYCRSAYRNDWTPGNRNNGLGFRLSSSPQFCP